MVSWMRGLVATSSVQITKTEMCKRCNKTFILTTFILSFKQGFLRTWQKIELHGQLRIHECTQSKRNTNSGLHIIQLEQILQCRETGISYGDWTYLIRCELLFGGFAIITSQSGNCWEAKVLQQQSYVRCVKSILNICRTFFLTASLLLSWNKIGLCFDMQLVESTSIWLLEKIDMENPETIEKIAVVLWSIRFARNQKSGKINVLL